MRFGVSEWLKGFLGEFDERIVRWYQGRRSATGGEAGRRGQLSQVDLYVLS